MLQFLDIQSFTKNLDPVISSDYFTKDGGFNINGLFSETIFGNVGSEDRRRLFSFIFLNSKIIHPTALRLLYGLNRKIEKFLSTEANFILDKDGDLIEDPDGVSGISAFIELFPRMLIRKDTERRSKLIKAIDKEYKRGNLFIDKLPIIPPGFRDAYQNETNEWVVDKLNDYYQTIMKRASNVKSAVGSGVLYDLINYGLQQAVVEHDKFIQTRIAKKHGLIREQMLGKRIDFSARSVITPGPQLKVNEIGIPFRMAVSLFEPFLIHRLLYSGIVNTKQLNEEIEKFTGNPLSVDSVRKVIKSIRVGDKIPIELQNIFSEATEAVMMNRYVVAKRDPALHAESVRAFRPILIMASTMQICPLQVGGFGADFDGDQMAIYHPLSDESQEEIRTKMTRATSGESSHAITFELSKEMYAGIYTLTKTSSSKSSPIAVDDEILSKATDPYTPVVYRKQNTTMGKAILNSCFPSNFPFISELVTKKIINGYISKLFEMKYSDDVIREVVSKLSHVGFKFATILAPTFSIDNLELTPEIYEIKRQLKTADTETAARLLAEAEKLLKIHLKDTGFYDLIESGSGKGWTQPMQILVAKGLIADPDGNVLPVIAGSFSEGLSNDEFYNASPGAMKGIIDRVHNTAETGYLSRRLAFILNTVEANPYLRDCKTNRVMRLTYTKDIGSRIVGRYIINKKGKVELFNPGDYKVGDTIQLRTPIYCKAPKICLTCYGNLISRLKTPYVGIAAAQIIGERGTQLIMRTFHTGGAVSLVKKDMLSDIADADPLTSKDIVSSNLKQLDNSLICKNDCKLTIILDNYEKTDISINEETDIIWLKSCICKIEFENSEFWIILDYVMNVRMINVIESNNDKIVLTFPADSIIMEATLESSELKKQVQFVDRLLGGREIYKDVEHIFRRLYNVYKEHSSMDSVHLEILISNCLRSKVNTSYPARLDKVWDPEMINVKNVVFNSGFVNGLSFENITKSIEVGLMSEQDLPPSVLEQVLTGTLVEEEK